MSKPDSATRRWIRNAADERAAAAGFRFNDRMADHAVTFFSRFLRHSKGEWAGKPFELLDWQRDDIIMPLFGWQGRDGFRRFRRTYIEIPKKQGKSTLASGVGLYLLGGDGEAGAEVYSAATDKDQASIVHGEAINMVEASPELAAVMKINHSTKNIHYAKTRSWYRALSKDAANKEGLNIHGIIIDELHAWRGRELWNALRYGMAARRQPIWFVITTAGDDMLSVCRQQHDYAESVLSGTIEDHHFLGYVRAAGSDDDPFDPATWRKANPSLGITMTETEFAADANAAKATAGELASFKRYRLNIWTTSENPWLKLDDWEAAGDVYSEDDLEGQECFGGLDLASTMDTASLALVFPPNEERDDYRLLVHFWLPAETAQKYRDIVPYEQWAKEGFITLTQGEVIDYDFIEARVAEIVKRFKFGDAAFDPWQAENITQRLENEHGVRRFSFAQTISNFAHPTSEFERLLKSGRLRHNRNAVLSWQASNVQVKTDPNANMRPVKPKPHDYRKVDGIVAGIMALARAIGADGPKESVYEKRGVRYL